MDTCTAKIDQFINQETTGWAGLPSGCEEDTILSAYPFKDGAGTVRLGDATVAYTFRVLAGKGFDEDISFCFADGQLALIIAEFPPAGFMKTFDAFSTAGEHALCYDLYWRDEIIEGGEWAFNSRGITFGIIPSTRSLVKIMVYPPCGADAYRRKYYHSHSSREF